MAVIQEAARYTPGRSGVVPWLLGHRAESCAAADHGTAARAAAGAGARAGGRSRIRPTASRAGRTGRRAAAGAAAGCRSSYREAVVLCDLQELSYQDAADAAGCAIGTIRSRLHRGRAILAEMRGERRACRTRRIVDRDDTIDYEQPRRGRASRAETGARSSPPLDPAREAALLAAFDAAHARAPGAAITGIWRRLRRRGGAHRWRGPAGGAGRASRHASCQPALPDRADVAVDLPWRPAGAAARLRDRARGGGAAADGERNARCAWTCPCPCCRRSASRRRPGSARAVTADFIVAQDGLPRAVRLVTDLEPGDHPCVLQQSQRSDAFLLPPAAPFAQDEAGCEDEDAKRSRACRSSSR